MSVRIELLQSLFVSVSKLTRAFKVAGTRTSHADDLTGLGISDTEALIFIGSQENCINSDIATYLGVAPTTATSIIDRLVRKGLVERKRTEDNRRVVRLVLTPNGSTMRQVFIEKHLTDCRRMLEMLTDEEQLVFVQLFAKVAEAVEQNRASDS
ncbi:MarR family winged helix-turn-helix transcriptional regulator [Nostoc sp. MS1]|uniref:MarR family winged helix-turn-helix transcriptional regulator n=1 Tax=Nostoc sp. MS1 TaxID=2764711 RepID=UPI001CC3CBF4|nr:MarR family transcriptional regulator [Nostoc sp. MS1]BCL38222.1 hypothetical protein NSMS1_46690 [Nostoc sp. MS1]